jgi:hypothetical protein
VHYNLFMGGVDMADQRYAPLIFLFILFGMAWTDGPGAGRRSYISAQLRVARTWVPLFFWLLCTALINTFLIAQQNEGGRRDTLFQCNRKFQTELAWQLVQEGYRENNPGHTPPDTNHISLGHRRSLVPSHSVCKNKHSIRIHLPGPTVFL